MNKTIKLSVSSVLLAGFMTGCTQQQYQGGGQQILGSSQSTGGQQVAGGQQVLGGQQAVGGSQSSGGQQVAGGQQVLGGQQQSNGMDAQVKNTLIPDRLVPDTSHLHNETVKEVVHAHNVEPQQRVYVPLPDSMKEAAQEVFMYDEPEPVKQPEPIYYGTDAEPIYYEQAAQAVMAASVIKKQKPTPRQKPAVQHKPVVQHRGIGMPPAQPGQCFAKVKSPAKFKNVVKRIQVSPAVNKRVKVRGPQYRWINKKAIARPATYRNKYIPAQYRNITKKVLVKPAHYAWQKGKKGSVTRIDNMTGEILCRVKIPAAYRTVTQRVVVRPAQRVKRYVPPVYHTVKQKKLASPAAYRTIRTPARFVNKTQRIQISGPRMQWKPIACKTPAQPASRNHASTDTSAKQRQLAAEHNRQQQILRERWIKQEAQRQGQSKKPKTQQHRHTPQNNNAQLKANQQRRAQHAIKEKQRLNKLAQQRKLAQQARLRQVQLAKQKRMAKHQANLLAQRKAAQMLRLNAPKPSYAQPKMRSAQAVHIPKPRQDHINRAKFAPKVRSYQQKRIAAQVKNKAHVKNVSHTPKTRVQQQNQAAQQTVNSSNDKTPLTRANAVLRIQKALLQRGFNTGTIDGKLGPTTVKALTAFQKTKGLKTGTLNRDTLRALGLVE